MNTTREYKLTVCIREQNGSKLIDEKAIEEGYTTKSPIMDARGFDSVWRDSEGNDITSGHRIMKDGNLALITVINSYFKEQRHNEAVVKHINMD
jgi:hypothetical protein